MTRRPLAIVLTATLVLGIGLGVALVHAHDARLDEAIGALEKAAALVEAAQTDPVSSQTQRQFDRNRAKALDSIEDAMDHITAAAAAVDSDGSK